MSDFFEFKNKTVFVAGGTSGINLGIAMGFAGSGANLVVVSRSPEKVEAAIKQLKSTGAEAMGLAVDVRDYEAVEGAFQKAQEKFGDIDVLVSGAAGNFPAFASALSPNGFKSVVDIDLIGSFNVMRAAYAYLKKPGASIVQISAPQAFVPMPLQVHVCAAKAGVDMLTRVLALEWGAEGIRINSIVPGPIEGTEGMARLAPTKEIKHQIKASVPLKRMGVSEDIANAAMFLSSPLASYINGVVLPVDGGWSLGGASETGSALATMFKTMQVQQS